MLSMKIKPLTVAITGMNALPDNPGPGLAVARCLREAYGENIRLIGLGYDALDPGLYLGQFCDSVYLLSYPLNGADILLERLEEIHAAEPIDVLIPCLDAELPLMVNLADKLAGLGIKTYLPNAEQFDRRSKARLAELALTADINYPEVKPLSSPKFFHHCEQDGWNYPLVVKGVFYDAKIVANAEQATAAFHSIAHEWGFPVLAQRFVAGEEYNLAGIGDGEGKLLGEVMMKKRAVTNKGKAWAGVATADETLVELARKLVAALNWKGPLEVEVMRDGKGQYHLIEINPRFPAWIYLSHGVGRNLPALLVELALGRPTPVMAAPRPGTMFIRHALETIVPMSLFESLLMQGQCIPETKG
jgi:carbamoyl-phosphate synthase large subunit